MRKLFALLFIAVSVLHAQPKFHPFFFEINTFPDDSLIHFYYSYRIPYNHLVFIKSGDEYNASVKINLELVDSLTNNIARQFDEKKISVDNFDLTNENQEYAEGLIKLTVPDGNYKILMFFTDNNVNKEFRFPPWYKRMEKVKKKFLAPVVVDAKKLECAGNEKYPLTNFNSDIPFSENEYYLIIPVKDTTIKSFKLTMIDNSDTIYNKNVTDNFINKDSFSECDGKIVFNNKGNVIFKNFIVKNFSQKLHEGHLKVEIKTDSSDAQTLRFIKRITWFNKPFSLIDPEHAIKALKYVEADSVIDELLSNKKKEFYNKLFDYWEKYDPTPATMYNPLMNEFYTRVDYAVKEFASIGNKNGANSDRGKIYIKFGKPQKIERMSNDNGRVVETWIYEKTNKKFIFIDKEGKGEFTLVSG